MSKKISDNQSDFTSSASGAERSGRGAGASWRTSLPVRIVLALLSVCVAAGILGMVAIFMADRPLKPRAIMPEVPPLERRIRHGSGGGERPAGVADGVVDEAGGGLQADNGGVGEGYRPGADGFDAPAAGLLPMDEHLQAIGRVIESPLPKDFSMPAELTLPPGMRVLNAAQEVGPGGELAVTIVGWATTDQAETMAWFERQGRADGWSCEVRPASADGLSQTLLLEKPGKRRVVTVRERPQGQGCLVGINLLE